MVFPSFDLPVVLDKQNLLLYTVLKYHLKYGFIKTYFLAEMYGRVLVLEYLLDNLSEPHLLLASHHDVPWLCAIELSVAPRAARQ